MKLSPEERAFLRQVKHDTQAPHDRLVLSPGTQDEKKNLIESLKAKGLITIPPDDFAPVTITAAGLKALE